MENTTYSDFNSSTMDDAKTQLTRTFSMFLIFVALAENLCCIFVLFRCKQLKENRFFSLTMFQSFSNMGTCLVLTTIIYITIFAKSAGIMCVILVGLMIAMIICSLYQTLLICLDRLFTAYEINPAFFGRISHSVAIFVAYTTIIFLVASFFLGFGNLNLKECGYSFVIGDNEHIFILVIDSVVFLLTFLISVIYTVVIIKIVHRHKQVHPVSSNTANKLRQCGITLGIVIVLSFVAILPENACSLSALLYPGSVSMATRRIMAAIYIIKPLLDPFVYVLRIRKFRGFLKCSCCINNLQ